MDKRLFRDACGAFATGVMVATCTAGGGRPVGVTVNSFSSVSLEPPLVLFCLARDAVTWQAFAAAEHFALNTLGEGQQALSDRFAAIGAALFDDVAWRPGALGQPLLAGASAALECTLAERRAAGDHDVFLGRVKHAFVGDGVRPLLYYRGSYAGLSVDPPP